MMIVGYLQQAADALHHPSIWEHNSLRLLHHTRATLIEMFSNGLLVV